MSLTQIALAQCLITHDAGPIHHPQPSASERERGPEQLAALRRPAATLTPLIPLTHHRILAEATWNISIAEPSRSVWRSRSPSAIASATQSRGLACSSHARPSKRRLEVKPRTQPHIFIPTICAASSFEHGVGTSVDAMEVCVVATCSRWVVAKPSHHALFFPTRCSNARCHAPMPRPDTHRYQ